MRIFVAGLLALGVVGTAAGVTSANGVTAEARRESRRDDAIFQTSTIGALTAAVLDGHMTVAKLQKHGNFGVGTFHALDGEMVVVDGSAYQVRVDGSVRRVPGSTTTPFAMVKWFRPERSVRIQGTESLDALGQLLDGLIASPNVSTAIRIEGRFNRILTRSVPAQSKPYAGLAEAVRQQRTFELLGVEGVMVGFRTPEYLAPLNNGGYHFHFLTADRKAGGHVLAVDISQARAQLDNSLGFRLALPGSQEFAEAVLPGQN
ncbi:MAG: acetolactate decarboxylase [Armatimonadota bacterium]